MSPPLRSPGAADRGEDTGDVLAFRGRSGRARRVGRSTALHGNQLDADSPARLSTSTFEELFASQTPALMALLVALTGDRGTAEDLCQETLLRAYRNWERITRYEKPEAWLRRVAINLAVSSARRGTRERRAFDRVRRNRAAAPPLEHGVSGGPEFWTLVRALPTQQRAAVALYYVDGYSVAEVALVLGCAEGTAKVHLHRGRRTLARTIRSDGPAQLLDPGATP